MTSANTTPGTPRLRFAPSPTGPLHIGGARTALYNWAAARAMGGQFLLRIEDTDRKRSTDESLQNILAALRWLGIDWDEGPEKGGEFGPYSQTERFDIYEDYASKLVASGHAYHCYCTPEEVDAGRNRMQKEHGRSMYDRACRELSDEQRSVYLAEGRESSIRFKMPLDEVVTTMDLSKGEVQVNTQELDDWVMVRANGIPLYNFACVVDDLLMKITHVVRGEEHFMNGIKQIVMFRALGCEPPRFAHIPLILGKEGKKLSKREAQTNLLDYRDQGCPPAAIFNYIAMLGWGFSGDRDLFTRDEMVAVFKIEKIGSAGAKFDEDKLYWMCGDYIRRTDLDELVALTRPFVLNAGVVDASVYDTHPGLMRNLVASFHERIKTYGELPGKLAAFFVDDDALELDAKAQKNMKKHEAAAEWLRGYAEVLEKSDLPPSWPADRGTADDQMPPPVQALEDGARAFAEANGIKFGHFVAPVRAALSGTNAGPGLFDILWLLGKERCLARLRNMG